MLPCLACEVLLGAREEVEEVEEEGGKLARARNEERGLEAETRGRRGPRVARSESGALSIYLFSSPGQIMTPRASAIRFSKPVVFKLGSGDLEGLPRGPQQNEEFFTFIVI